MRRKWRIISGWMLIAALLAAVQPTSASGIEWMFQIGDVDGSNVPTMGSATILPPASATKPDWGDLFDASGQLNPTFSGAAAMLIADDLAIKGLTDRTIFAGTNKNNMLISEWNWDKGNVPAKDDLSNVYGAAYMDSGNHLQLFFGVERIAAEGDSHIDIEINQSQISTDKTGECGIDQTSGLEDDPPCEFLGERQVNDLLISLDFEQGGNLGLLQVRKWDGTQWVLKAHILRGSTDTCNPVMNGTPPNILCAVNNNGDIDGGPWPNYDKSGAVTTLVKNAFTELALDVTALLGGTPCFATLQVKTRSSASFTAELMDFAMGSDNICGSITIIKDAIPDDAGPFDFSFDDSVADTTTNFQLTGTENDGDRRVFSNLLNGTYLATETGEGPTGWALDSLACVKGDVTDETVVTYPSANTAEIDLAFGEDVTCTFTNLPPATIIIQKVTDPVDDPQEFTFASTTLPGLTNGEFDLQGGESQTFQYLEPGTYSVAENVPDGWDLTSFTCDGSGNSPAAITVAAGETVTCIATNTKLAKIIVQKQTAPDGDPQVFDFTANYDADGFSLADGQSNDSGYLDPGDGYSVSETAPSGWDLTSFTCDDGSDPSAISLSAGEVVTCTATNTKRGKIVVMKQTLPDGDPQSFAFTADYDADGFNLADGENNDSGSIVPGPYSVAETVPEGWDLTSFTCDDGSDPSAISLSAGEVVTCTANNTKLAKIIVEKQTTPDGDTQIFAYTASYDADGFNLSDGLNNDSGYLDPGTYSVAETPLAGWDLTSVTCSDGSPVDAIELSPGETVTCTFNNTKLGKIIVQKQTTPDGDVQVFAYTASYDADGFNLSDGLNNDSGYLDPGTYSVAETPLAGWDMTSVTCSDGSPVDAIALAAGETVTCTFNNTKLGKIIVQKQTTPDGDTQAFAFTASYDADGFNLTDGQNNDSGYLDPGTYSVAETALAGWDLTAFTCDDGSPINAIALAAGEVVTCTANNTKRGKIIVEKQTLPDGDLQAFAYTASYDADGFSLSDGQSNDSGLLVPGSYSVAETALAGWDLTSASCSDGSPINAIALAAGETVTCTFTNTKRGSIKIIKDAVPNSAQSFNFTTSGSGLSPFALSDTGSSQNWINFTNLVPGAFEVTETMVEFWNLEGLSCTDPSGGTVSDLAAGKATIALAPGENIVCTFTNTYPYEGCTPGYWKNHLSNWPAPYTTSTTFVSVFGTIPGNAGNSTTTLLDAVNLQGGGNKALVRHAASAILNIAAGLEYLYSQSEVISMYNAALTGGMSVNSVIQMLTEANEIKCTLN